MQDRWFCKKEFRSGLPNIFCPQAHSNSIQRRLSPVTFRLRFMQQEPSSKISLSWLRWIGVGLFAVGLVIWLFGGAHMGWTQTEVTEFKIDEITGIEYPEIQDKLLPGVEFPVLGLVAMVGFVALEIVLRKISKIKTSS